jgi:cytochrome c-type biogenesis protein CcmH/NrfG
VGGAESGEEVWLVVLLVAAVAAAAAAVVVVVGWERWRLQQQQTGSNRSRGSYRGSVKCEREKVSELEGW